MRERASESFFFYLFFFFFSTASRKLKITRESSVVVCLLNASILPLLYTWQLLFYLISTYIIIDRTPAILSLHPAVHLRSSSFLPRYRCFASRNQEEPGASTEENGKDKHSSRRRKKAYIYIYLSYLSIDCLTYRRQSTPAMGQRSSWSWM